METDIPKMFRFTVFLSPGLQPWVSRFPGIKIAQKSHTEGVYALPQTTHKKYLSKKGRERPANQRSIISHKPSRERLGYGNPRFKNSD